MFGRVMEKQLGKMHLNPDPLGQSQPSNNELADSIEDIGEEYEALDATLDQLNAHMDLMEQRNDDLFAKFQELLESSKQTRMEMEAERLANGTNSDSTAGQSQSAETTGPSDGKS